MVKKSYSIPTALENFIKATSFLIQRIDNHEQITPALRHDVRAASNLNSRRLRDASAASAAPDLMNREGWGRPQGGS